MVVHEDNERPVEVGVIKKPLLERKTYLIVKNHVKELSTSTSNEEKTQSISGNHSIKKKLQKSTKKLQKVENAVTSYDFVLNKQTTEIDSEDLSELRTLYTKCRDVVSKIERKYGHLLEDTEASPSKCIKRHIDDYKNECQCRKKRKIVFDDEGKQSTIDFNSDMHICIEKLKNVSDAQAPTRNIEVEYQDVEMGLPDNLQELSDILHDPNIEKTHRNKVLEKIRVLKQEYGNEIRFNKHIIIEQLKCNCDEVLDFKGTNLSIIPGYS